MSNILREISTSRFILPASNKVCTDSKDLIVSLTSPIKKPEMNRLIRSNFGLSGPWHQVSKVPRKFSSAWNSALNDNLGRLMTSINLLYEFSSLGGGYQKY
jgi:hypothetical protein